MAKNQGHGFTPMPKATPAGASKNWGGNRNAVEDGIAAKEAALRKARAAGTLTSEPVKGWQRDDREAEVKSTVEDPKTHDGVYYNKTGKGNGQHVD